MKTLIRNIYFAKFDSHLSYSCIVWAQSINTVRRLIILHKKALQVMNFKEQLFHSSPLLSSTNQKYGCFSIRASAIHSWNYIQDMLKLNLSLKNSIPKSIKYFLSVLLKVTNNFCILDHNLHGIYTCTKLIINFFYTNNTFFL